MTPLSGHGRITHINGGEAPMRNLTNIILPVSDILGIHGKTYAAGLFAFYI